MAWDRLRQTVAPTAQIIDLATVKTHLYVDYTDSDTYITGLIAAATLFMEGPHGSGFALCPQSWRMTLDSLQGHSIDIPLGPVTSIDSITYLDTTGAQQTLDPSLYVTDLDSDPANVSHAYGATWPNSYSVRGSVKVNFTCGYPAVPADLVHCALLIIGVWFEARSGVIGIDQRNSPSELPLGVEAILSKYRAIAFG